MYIAAPLLRKGKTSNKKSLGFRRAIHYFNICFGTRSRLRNWSLALRSLLRPMIKYHDNSIKIQTGRKDCKDSISLKLEIWYSPGRRSEEGGSCDGICKLKSDIYACKLQGGPSGHGPWLNWFGYRSSTTISGVRFQLAQAELGR